MTGLSDDQRANFNLIKSMGEYTKQDPAKSTNTLMKFSQKLTSNKEIVEEMQGWNLKFAQDLLKFRSRKIKVIEESTPQSREVVSARWSRNMRKP